MTIEPHEKFKANKPKVGTQIHYKGQPAGQVTRTEGNLCYVKYSDGETLPFIWAFREGLNTLHDWPGKTQPATTDGSMTP